MQLFQPLLALIASASDSILAQQLSYAQAELKIMRARLPKRIVVTPEERAILLKHGRRRKPLELRQLFCRIAYRCASA